MKPMPDRAIDVVARRLAEQDPHTGRAFVAWVRDAFSRNRMPRRLADYFERGVAPDEIPSCVLAFYGAVAKKYLEQKHAPRGLHVQARRLHRIRGELDRRLRA